MMRRGLVVLVSLVAACRRAPSDERVGPPSLDLALADLAVPDRSRVPVVITTSEGDIRCQLDGTRAPRAVGMFVGLARGRARWREPDSARVVDRPFYDGLLVFRGIPNVLFQSGCPRNDGTGTPGYRIEVERSDSDHERLARGGALVLARYTAPPNRPDPAPPKEGEWIGSQFAVTVSDMSHLEGRVTVLGTCGDLEIASRIANVVGANQQIVRVHTIRVGR